MSTKLYYTGIDLQQNELQNAVIHQLASAPSNPLQGQIYYNTTDDALYVYDGAAWAVVGASQLTVAADSTAFVSITDNELHFSNLAITEVHVDTTQTSIANFIAANYAVGNEFQEGDMIILTAATDQSQRSWIHNGGTAGNANDFTRLQTDLNATEVKALFSAGSGLDYADGAFSVEADGITAAMINADVAGNGLEQNATTGALDVKVDNSSIKIVNDTLTVDGDVVGTALAGAGIVKNGTTLDVNVDNSTLEVASDVVQVKDSGITQAKLDSTLEAKIVNGYAATVGDGTATSFNITHNLGTNDVMVNIYKISTGECVTCNVARTSVNAISVGAFPAPASNDLRVLIQKVITA